MEAATRSAGIALIPPPPPLFDDGPIEALTTHWFNCIRISSFARLWLSLVKIICIMTFGNYCNNFT